MYNCIGICTIVLVLVFKIGKRQLTFSKRLGRQFISLKKVHLNELKLIILVVNRKQLILPCSYP